jgi:hypothetical protein
MIYKFVYIFFFFNCYVNSIYTQENIKEVYTLKYKIINEDIDFSGYKGFLPKTINKLSFVEIGNIITNIFNEKGIEIDNLEIIDNGKNQLSIIITFNTKEIVNEIKLDDQLQELFDQFQKQNQEKNPLKANLLKNIIGISHYRWKGIIEIIKLFNEKTGNLNNIILTKKNKNILYINSYHKDIPVKTINNLKFFFVHFNKNSIEYTTKIPDYLELNKLKNSLVIEENNFLYSFISFFIKFPPIQINQRDGENLKKYIKSQGYNNGQLLDIKYIENNNGYSAYVYILIGEKLNIYNVTFSIDNINNYDYNNLLKELSNENFQNDLDLLEVNYIPNKIYQIVKKYVKIPCEIIKTINEISIPKESYNINFNIKTTADDYFIENIYFINNSDNKCFDIINSKIGYNFNLKNIEKDKKILNEYYDEKIEANVHDGSVKNGKIIIFNIGEAFDLSKILEKLKPNFFINFEGFNLKKNIQFNIPINELLLPLNGYIHFHKEKIINRYVLDSKFQINLNKLLFNYLKKKDKENAYFNLIAGSTYIFNNIKDFFNNFNKKYLGINIGNNNFKKWKLFNKIYYKNNLDILYFFQKIEKDTDDYSLLKNGWNYKYKFLLGKENFFNLNDNIEIDFNIQDSINKKLLFNNAYFNININHAIKCFDKIFIQNNLEFLLTKNDNQQLYSIKEIYIIGKKEKNYTYNYNYDFYIGCLWFFTLAKKIKDIDIFIGQKIEILIGLYLNYFFCRKKDKEYNWKRYGGFICTFKTSLGCLNIYIPLSILGGETEKYLYDIKLFDFSLESNNNSIKDKKELFIYKPKITLNDKIIQ